MLASEVIKALHQAGVLYSADPEALTRARAENLERHFPSGIDADLGQLGLGPSSDGSREDALNGILTDVVQTLVTGVKDEPLHALLSDPAKFGFAIEDLGGRFNARSFAVGDAWLALIDRALMTGVYGTARAICGRFATPLTREADRPTCETCGEAACTASSLGVSARRWFESGLRMHFATEQVWEDWDAPRDRLLASDGLARSAESFVVAHEISHHLFGHTAPGAAQPGLRDGVPDSIREFLPSWEMEVQADQGATQLVIYAAARGQFDRPHEEAPFINAAVGIEHFWCTAELLERTAPRPTRHDTHPPVSVRRAGVDTVYRQNPHFEVMRAAAASYRALHQALWRTLASPSEHDIEGWDRQRAEAIGRVHRCLQELASVVAAESINSSHLVPVRKRFAACRWRSSKLFFDAEVLRLARTALSTDPIARAAQVAWVRWCDTPEELAAHVDHRAAFLGVPTRLSSEAFGDLFES